MNKKFRIIRKNSSTKEYRSFQAFMSENNPSSPLKNFGKNVTRHISIELFKFKRMKINNIIAFLVDAEQLSSLTNMTN